MHSNPTIRHLLIRHLSPQLQLRQILNPIILHNIHIHRLRLAPHADVSTHIPTPLRTRPILKRLRPLLHHPKLCQVDVPPKVRPVLKRSKRGRRARYRGLPGNHIPGLVRPRVASLVVDGGQRGVGFVGVWGGVLLVVWLVESRAGVGVVGREVLVREVRGGV